MIARRHSRSRAGMLAIGVAAAWLAMMVQLAVGAIVPRFDPVAAVLGAQTQCDAASHANGGAPPTPMRSLDCLACPLCMALHVMPMLTVPMFVPPARRGIAIRIAHVLPPATAPPAAFWTPRQPRAPPVT